jgi:hypothetical protein
MITKAAVSLTLALSQSRLGPALVTGCADNLAQQRLAVLDRAGAQVVAVEVEKVEGEIGEPLGSTLAHRLVSKSIMGDAVLVGHRDLAVEDERRQPGGG